MSRASYSDYSTSPSGQAGYTTSISGLWCSTYNEPQSMLKKHHDESFQERLRSKYTLGVQASTCDCYCNNADHTNMLPYMSYTYDNFSQLGYGTLDRTPPSGTKRRNLQLDATFK